VVPGLFLLNFTMLYNLQYRQFKGLMKLLLISGLIIFSSFSGKRYCDVVPVLNKQVVNFVKTTINQKVGRGECWDLAAAALNSVNAKWDKKYNFGREVNAEKECVFPGDIMQFEDVNVKYMMNGYFYEDIMRHHTAVVYEVKGKGDFIIAEQNTSLAGKKVALHPLDLGNITSGVYKIFRPVASVND
jgi:hypothetical protein